MRLLEWAAGLLLAWATLRDVFDTVIVAGQAKGPLKVSRRLVLALLPICKRLRPGGVGPTFAPAVLVGAFACWMLLLVTAFGLMVHAERDAFDPPLGGLGHALYIAGGAMTTLGFGQTEPSGAASVVVVAASFCGLAAMTLAVTYLLEVQANITVRDEGVLKITTTAGNPPSALAVLERYAGFGAHGDAVHVLHDGRQWCASVLQSHAWHPSLVYFRSADAGAGWPAALGALVDLALVHEWLLDQPHSRAAAALAREEARRLSRDVTQVLGLQAVVAPVALADVQALVARLVRAGYAVRAGADLAGFAKAREDNASRVHALADHLGTPVSPLLPPERPDTPAT